VFSLFKRRKKDVPPKDPIAAFDAVIEQLERQGAEVRKSAATLLAAKGELTRSWERYQRQRVEMEARIGTARERGDGKAEAILRRDLEQAQKNLQSTEEGLARVEGDAEVLLELARELTDQSTHLRAERNSARARLDADSAVTETLKHRSRRIEQVLAVDAARDELERAHALADVYREDAGVVPPRERVRSD
jgi:chromosome segregation ATPase